MTGLDHTDWKMLFSMVSRSAPIASIRSSEAQQVSLGK